MVIFFMHIERVNDQGVKRKKKKKKKKKQRFWSVNSPPGEEFSLAPKMMHAM